MPHTHHALEEDPQPTIFSTRYNKLSKACNHDRYWRICKDKDCKALVKTHDDDTAIAALRAAAERLQREEDTQRMPPPHLKHRHAQRAHMTHLLGQLASHS